jgi:two-component system, LytTR family, sensor kinase
MKLRNIEIALATLALIFIFYKLFASIDGYIAGRFSDAAYGREMFVAKGLQFNFWINYFIPPLLKWFSIYVSFIWTACSLPDKFITARKWQKAALLIIAGTLVIWMLFVLSDYLKMPFNDHILSESLYREFGVVCAISGAVLLYEILKQTAIWLLQREPVTKKSWSSKPFTNDIIWFVIIWGVVLFGCAILMPYRRLGLFLALISPSMFGSYLVCYYLLIPKYYCKGDKNSFWMLVLFSTFIINIPLTGFYIANISYGDIDFAVKFLFAWLLQVAIILPLSFFLYKSRQNQIAELNSLKTELGTSNAGLQFLRSQINPHFLFNALNTLYGTALMENAEKTGEGIQKLGDMMRFMLHENHQDKIALSRELDYLHNYVDLQNLRIAASPNISIEMQIEDIIGYYEIAPMLLIPFIENAYKHGISLKEKSWIKVTLYKKDEVLHLDVYNSVHPQKENDPERYHSGTGLENVKQRLALLYANKHELIIRQNAQEFFIHLSITLSSLNQPPATENA